MGAWLRRHAPVTVLTGAGVSTGSGVADYRDRQGRWKLPQPVTLQDFVGALGGRQRYWLRSLGGWPQFRKAQPNSAHQALARAEQAGLLRGVVTQNVDGLHQAAGSRLVIDLHGRNNRVVCMACHWGAHRDWLQAALEDRNPHWRSLAGATDGALAGFQVVDCPACGGIVRPDVVFFGDSVPRERVATARDWVATSGGLLVLGSSLMVYSGFRYVRQAAAVGIATGIVNRGRTRADDLAQWLLDGDVGTVLEAAVAAAEVAP